jgi:hypothetical protein
MRHRLLDPAVRTLDHPFHQQRRHRVASARATRELPGRRGTTRHLDHRQPTVATGRPAQAPTRGLALRRDRHRVEVVAWNTSTAAIIAATLVGWPLLTTAGAASLLLAVGSFIRQVPVAPPRHRWPATAHWALAGLVAVSAPVGVILAWIRHG